MNVALNACGLGKRYGNSWALRDCSLRVPAGRITGLVGPNGAGKTTLLRMAVGLLGATSGEISVFGWSPTEHPALVLARVGFVPQERPLYSGFTVGEILQLGRHLNPRWDQAGAAARLKRLDIGLNRKVAHLSGGQHAQVSLALALGNTIAVTFAALLQPFAVFFVEFVLVFRRKASLILANIIMR